MLIAGLGVSWVSKTITDNTDNTGETQEARKNEYSSLYFVKYWDKGNLSVGSCLKCRFYRVLFLWKSISWDSRVSELLVTHMEIPSKHNYRWLCLSKWRSKDKSEALAFSPFCTFCIAQFSLSARLQHCAGNKRRHLTKKYRMKLIWQPLDG